MLLLALLLTAGAWVEHHGGEANGRPAQPLLLFTSLPIYWPEAADVGATLKAGAQPHWARRAIEARRRLRPVDTLDAGTLQQSGDLLMIQPRPLAPVENVALDDWVARGGKLLLFADPALTAASRFAIGDRRRPQDIVLLSPILARWGLRLEFDDEQPLGEHAVEIDDGTKLSVDLPGRFAKAAGGRADSACRLSAAALVAECTVGRGRVLAIADAALFAGGGERPRHAALDALLARAFR